MFFFYYPSCFSFCYLLIVLFFLVVFRVLFLSVCFLFFFSSCFFPPSFFFVELCFRVVFPFFPRVVLLSWFQVVVPFKKAKTLFEIVVQFFFF